jgi:hypothetical protein
VIWFTHAITEFESFQLKKTNYVAALPNIMFNAEKRRIECRTNGRNSNLSLSAVGCSSPNHCNEMRSKCLDDPASCRLNFRDDKDDDIDLEEKLARVQRLVGTQLV